jgi:hypothetical protein
MSTAPTTAPIQRPLELLGQTVVVTREGSP